LLGWLSDNVTNVVAMYRRLRAAGKEHKLALAACVRKHVIFAKHHGRQRTAPVTRSVQCAGDGFPCKVRRNPFEILRHRKSEPAYSIALGPLEAG
jgi:hypothetical protein